MVPELDSEEMRVAYPQGRIPDAAGKAGRAMTAVPPHSAPPQAGAATRGDPLPRARCLAEFAPGPIAPYLEHVWLGVPGDTPEEGVRIPLLTLGAHRGELLDAMVQRYGGDAALHARALLSQWSK